MAQVTLSSVGSSGGNIDGIYIAEAGGGGNGIDRYFEGAGEAVYYFPGPFTSFTTIEEAATIPPAFRVHMLVSTGATVSSGGLIILGDDMDHAGDLYCWISQAGHWTMGQQSTGGPDGSRSGPSQVQPNTPYDLTFLYGGGVAQIFVDGELELAAPLRMSHPTSIQRVTIGAGRHADFGSPCTHTRHPLRVLASYSVLRTDRRSRLRTNKRAPGLSDDEVFDFGVISDVTVDDGAEVWQEREGAAEVCSTTGGTAPEASVCVFPFVYKEVSFTECTGIDNGGTPWCRIGRGAAWGNCQCSEVATADIGLVYSLPGPYSSYVTVEEAATLPPAFRIHMLVSTGATVSSGGLIILGDDMDHAGDLYCWISQAGHWTMGQQSVPGGSVDGTTPIRPNTPYDLTFLYDGTCVERPLRSRIDSLSMGVHSWFTVFPCTSTVSSLPSVASTVWIFERRTHWPVVTKDGVDMGRWEPRGHTSDADESPDLHPARHHRGRPARRLWLAV